MRVRFEVWKFLVTSMVLLIGVSIISAGCDSGSSTTTPKSSDKIEDLLTDALAFDMRSIKNGTPPAGNATAAYAQIDLLDAPSVLQLGETFSVGIHTPTTNKKDSKQVSGAIIYVKGATKYIRVKSAVIDGIMSLYGMLTPFDKLRGKQFTIQVALLTNEKPGVYKIWNLKILDSDPVEQTDPDKLQEIISIEGAEQETSGRPEGSSSDEAPQISQIVAPSEVAIGEPVEIQLLTNSPDAIEYILMTSPGSDAYLRTNEFDKRSDRVVMTMTITNTDWLNQRKVLIFALQNSDDKVGLWRAWAFMVVEETLMDGDEDGDVVDTIEEESITDGDEPTETIEEEEGVSEILEEEPIIEEEYEEDFSEELEPEPEIEPEPEPEPEPEIEPEPEPEPEPELEPEPQIPDCHSEPVVVGSPDTDDDNDGITENQGDCDDSHNTVNPAMPEIFDGLDNNCDGTIDEGFDDDCDGYQNIESGGDDCDDSNYFVNPGAEDDIPNHTDMNCDGKIGAIDSQDADNDGWTALAPDGSTLDCDDTDRFVHPWIATNEENPSACMKDWDMDGYGDSNPPENVVAGSDCIDDNPWVHPGAKDIPDDGIDNDCDGTALQAAVDDSMFIFVDGENGDDINPGTKEAPKKTLAMAINMAKLVGKDIIVATGEYTDLLSLDGTFAMFGGYDPTTWTRVSGEGAAATILYRPSDQPSAIEMASSEADVLLEGMTIKCEQSADQTADMDEVHLVHANQGRLKVWNSKIYGCDETANEDFFTMIDFKVEEGAYLQIFQNQIECGRVNQSYNGRMTCIFDDGELDMINNRVNGGYAGSMRIVSINHESSAKIIGNYIHGGEQYFEKYLIEMDAPSSLILIHNTLWTGISHQTRWESLAGIDNSSGYVNSGCQMLMINNVIKVGEGNRADRKAAIITKKEGSLTLIHNDLWTQNGSSNLIMWSGYNRIYVNDDDLMSCNFDACNESEGNIISDPGDYVDTTYHLPTGSTLIDAGTNEIYKYYQGNEYYLDMDGDPRLHTGSHPDIGADEYTEP